MINSEECDIEPLTINIDGLCIYKPNLLSPSHATLLGQESIKQHLDEEFSKPEARITSWTG